MTKLKISVAIIFALAAITFAVQNSNNVEFQFLIWQMVAPRAFILLTTFLMGMFVGLVFAVTLFREGSHKKEPPKSGSLTSGKSE